MNENDSINLNNNIYIKTNKDDINSLQNLQNSIQQPLLNINNDNDNNNNDTNDINNINNNYLNSNFNLFSPFGMAGMYMMGGQNTFFDKIFMTLERANYQMYHLCEMIKLIKNQKPTLKFFKALLISAFNTLKQKYYEIIKTIKEYLINIKDIFSFNNDKFSEEDLKGHIKIIDYAIKFLLGCLLLIITFQII